MKTVFLAIFALSAAVHLYASAKKDRKLRNLTKPFLLPSLLGFYLLAAHPPAAFIALALLFSWLGDVLLIPTGTKCFTLGGVAFLISHAFFVAGYWKDVDFAKLPAPLILLLAVFFAAAAAFLFSRLKKHLPKALFYPMLAYLLVNGAMNCFAVFRAVSLGTASGAVTAAGAALFFVSDCLLFFVRFKKGGRLKTHFPVMLTYLLGELLIVLGLV